MRTQGINSGKTKMHNRLLVLRLLCTGANLSRAEITRHTGLAKMTVTNIIAELLESGLVCESQPLATARKGQAGRKQTALRLSDTSPLGVGIWLSRDFCIGVLATMDLTVLRQYRIDFTENETAQSLVARLAEVVDFLRAGVDRPLLGVGVATIGPLDAEAGVMLDPPNFYGIRALPLAEKLEEKTGLPVFLKNDMNAGALAEKYFGSCRNSANFVYVGLTNGIGAGMVLQDALFEGRHGFAGEIGHISIDKNGPLCHCGNRGCLETYVHVPRLVREFRQRFGEDEARTFADVCRLAQADAEAGEMLGAALEDLSIALVNLCNVVDPDTIVIGHEGVAFTDGQLARLQRNVNAGVLGRSAARVEVKRCSFGTYTPAWGAVVVLLERVWDGGLSAGLPFGDEAEGGD